MVIHKPLFLCWGIALVLGLIHCGEGNGADLPASTNHRIISGFPFEELPAIGAFVYEGREYCTGTLIGPRQVLTAAHCVVDRDKEKMKFVLGPSISAPQYTFGIANFKPHPQYPHPTTKNDIALVILDSDAVVPPLKVISNSMDDSWIGKQLLFVGYGTDNPVAESIGVKRAAWMGISEVWDTTFEHKDSEKNVCFGDSGGPALVKEVDDSYRIAGVASTVPNILCFSNGIHMRVDPYVTFFGADFCQGESEKGRCEGEVLIHCVNNKVETQDCAAQGGICMISAKTKGYACKKISR